MRWLLTTPADADLDRLRERLASLGCTVSDEPPVPLDPDEQVLVAEGPRDLAEKLADADAGPVKASPDSPMDFYSRR